MNDCNASKVKLLHELSKISWYLDKFAPAHSENAGHPACTDMYDEMRQDLDKHMDKLKQAVSGLAREGKF